MKYNSNIDYSILIPYHPLLYNEKILKKNYMIENIMNSSIFIKYIHKDFDDFLFTYDF